MKIADISDRQLEIIGAAGKILTSEGVNGLTIKNLAKQMQFSEAAIYRHFTSKEEIILAMLNYLAESMDERYSGLSKVGNPEDRVSALFQEQFRFFNMNPHFVVAVFSDGLMEESKRINEAIARIMAVKVKHLAPALREGQREGIFINVVPADDLLHIVMGSFRLLMFKWRISNFHFDIKKAGDKLIQSVLILIKNKKS
jgi:Transcriptional regulator